MVRSALVLTILALVGCDTFRSLDSVAVPDDPDSQDMTPMQDADVTTDVGRDTGNDMPDTSVDSGSEDMRADVTSDDGGDMADGVIDDRCGARQTRPHFEAATNHLVRDVDIDPSDFVQEDVSIAASAPDTPPMFVTGHQFDDGSISEPIVTVASVTGTVDRFVPTHAVAEPFSGVAVARAPGPNEFAYLATATAPGCVDFGIQATSGLLDVSGIPTQISLETIVDACGIFQTPAAVTGPDGVAPNTRVLRTTLPNGEVRAYPWTVDMPDGTAPGNQFVSHVSASTKDLIATPGIGLDEWWIWRPGLQEQPVFVDIGGAGRLEVEHLYDDCYVTSAPAMNDAVVAPVTCETEGCVVGNVTTVLIGERIERADVAPMPGGGFVLVTSIGEATQRVEARFFDDRFQPAALDGELVVEIVPPGPRIGGLAVATTTNANDIFVGVVYSAVGPVERRVGLAVIEIETPSGP